MSLLRWKELAKSKSELGDKINYAHDLIKKQNISRQTSQESLERMFKPVTSKLEDVIDSNLDLRRLPRKKRPPKKGEVPDYGIDIEDELKLRTWVLMICLVIMYHHSKRNNWCQNHQHMKNL